ncbi:MAG TPA: hypothetical protein VJ746_19585 [Nitrospira sp.]|nr:hypothetical protein [Nitrospira sp.]
MNTPEKAIVDRGRKEIENARGTGVWLDFVHALKIISQVIFTRSAGFVLELIQNAEDAGRGLEHRGHFKIAINKKRVKIVHNGRGFTENDIRAICGIRSSKKPEKGSLGYLGIGFKSVFKITDAPEIYSNGFRFKFDRNYKGWNDPVRTPWHVLPLWLDKPSEPIDRTVTTFIIPFRDSSVHAPILQELKDLKTELYLFLRWIKLITIIDEHGDSESTLEEMGENDGITALKHDTTEYRFRIFRKMVSVPEYVKKDRLTQEFRAKVPTREIAIAFALDASGNLDPSEAGAMYGGVYSFLPLAESSSGAKFPIQADFLVQPGRDAINYEAVWNKWLLEEIIKLCKEAIAEFKAHHTWKYQYLRAFEFRKYEDSESYQKLFGPKLIQPIESYIHKNACIPTIDERWANPNEAVRIVDSSKSVDDLVRRGLVDHEKLAEVFGDERGLKLVHHDFKDQQVSPLAKCVTRKDFLNNEFFLNSKAKSTDAATWFRNLYLWLMSNPVTTRMGRTWQTEGYHNHKIVLTSKGELDTGGNVFLIDIASPDSLLNKMATALEKGREILHPAVMQGLDEGQRNALRGFLTRYTGVQLLEERAVCIEVALPKILTSSPHPSKNGLLQYTKFCKSVLGSGIETGKELWVLTKTGEIRTAKEAFFSQRFKPTQNWEANSKYLPGLTFISAEYLSDGESDEDLKGWREFFVAGGIKDAPDGVCRLLCRGQIKCELSNSCKSRKT